MVGIPKYAPAPNKINQELIRNNQIALIWNRHPGTYCTSLQSLRVFITLDWMVLYCLSVTVKSSSRNNYVMILFSKPINRTDWPKYLITLRGPCSYRLGIGLEWKCQVHVFWLTILSSCFEIVFRTLKKSQNDSEGESVAQNLRLNIWTHHGHHPNADYLLFDKMATRSIKLYYFIIFFRLELSPFG